MYSLLNYDHPYYSIEAISKVKVERISSSDLVKLSYEIDDPWICQQTLQIYIDVCIKKYKDLKENGSDAVVKYFETQLSLSESKLKAIEQKLLKFNQDNNIINYYEQSKAIAIVKEDMNVVYNDRKAKLAGSEASAKRLEEKLAIQEMIQAKNNAIVDSKKELGELNYKIGMYSAKSNGDEESTLKINKLKEEADKLQKEIKTNVDELYSFQNSVDGVPIKKVLPDWVDRVVEAEDLKAKLSIIDGQNKVIEEQFASYAPAGANLKKIEREINVAEQEYLEILHGLNLAKLKFQDTQLSSNLTSVDPPYFPLKPIPSKRKFIVFGTILITFVILIVSILMMEFFDETLKNETKASKKLNIKSMGMIPKLFRAKQHINLIKIQERMMDFIMQKFSRIFELQDDNERPKLITVFSTRFNEGKSLISANIAKKLKESGASVLVLNHSKNLNITSGKVSVAWLYKLFGYEDPRVDYTHPFFLSIEDNFNPSEYVYYKKLNKSFMAKIKEKNKNVDYIFVELPSLLETNYPSDLIKQSDLAIMVCRSNRLWSVADDNILDKIKDLIKDKLYFIINGVNINEVEAVLGELPKKRSKSRILIKNIFNLQFFTRNQI